MTTDEFFQEFPPQADPEGQSPPPADIPDPWEGPSTFAEDYYSGGDVPPDARNPHMLPNELEGEELKKMSDDGKRIHALL